MSRNQDLIALYPAAVWLVDHPSEGPTSGPSTLPKHGRTPSCPEAGPYACTAGSKPTLFPFPLPQDTPASWHWSNDSAIAPCSKMRSPEPCHNEQRRSTMPRRGPRAPISLAPDSAPCNATLPTHAAHPADMSSIVLARHVQSNCGPRSNRTHSARAYASWRVPVLLRRQESQSNERDWTSGSSQPVAPHVTQGSLVTNSNTLGGPHHSPEENDDHCRVGSHGGLLQRLSLEAGVPQLEL
jgi:hypothetical protein